MIMTGVMKKYYNLFIFVLAALFSMPSCVEENFGEDSYTDDAGTIRFSTSSAVDVESKTVYGDLTDNKWPIYWTNSDVVKVYCPQAQGDSKSEKIADYAVQNAAETQSFHSDLSLANNTQALKWGAQENHEFYTFYPASRVYITGEDGTFTVSVPRQQNAKVSKVEASSGNTFRAVDMSAAVMAGHTTVSRSSVGEDDIVILPFKPITTAFDIEIGAPVSLAGVENAITTTYITSITIANKSEVVEGRIPLSGGFTYNAKTGEYNLYNNTVTTEDAQSYTVNVQLDTPVELRAGTQDKLIVTVFLIPETLPDIRVIVNCRENTVGGAMAAQTATIKMSTKSPELYKGKKNQINLGNLPNPIVFSYETWMANLPDETYVSQISMPGTHDAGAYASTSTLDNALAQTQYLDIENQLDAGIRVLDFRPKYVVGNKEFNIAHGYVTYEDRSFDYVAGMAIEWLAEHPTEFLIFMLKNEYGSNDDSMSGWQANMRNKLLSVSGKYRIDSFDPSMTLKEARGKILFLSRDFYVGEDGNTSDHNHGQWVGGKFNFGIDNNDYTAGFIGFGKSYLKNWKTKVFTSLSESELGEIFTISDLYRGGYIGSGTGLVSPDESDKKDCISSTITAAYSDKSVNTWYFTFLNVSGASLRTKTYNEYASNLISGISNTNYCRAGVVLFDWACPFSGSGSVKVMGDNGALQTISVTNQYSGYQVMKSIIDNNFKGGGPAKKQ